MIRRRMTRHSFRLVLSFAVMLLAQTASAQDKARPVFENGMAQIVPAFQDSSKWVRHDLWVETNFDSDRDGKKDRVHVDVTRPGQTDTEGLRVPVLFGSSPYFAGTSRDFVGWDVKQELGAEPSPRGRMGAPPYQANRRRISNALVNEWVRRGFAVVHSEAPGTGLSQGCPTVGAEFERMPMKFVVDWLNGRAKGYTAATGGDEVKAPWSTGKVGMMGTSYEGTLPFATATTGVDGLEVVVPVSPNNSYYHYYRSNGLVRSPGGYLGEDVDVLYDFIASGDTLGRANCERIWKNGIFAGPKGQDRQSGDYNDFWADRDLMAHVKNVKAAVLFAHGLNDYNVMPDHSTRFYDALKSQGKKVGLYLHQGGHGGNPPLDMLNRWFSHYLYGVDNGVEKDPPVWIVHDQNAQFPIDPATVVAAAAQGGGRGRGGVPPTAFASFPVPGTASVTLYPSAGGNGVASLATSPSTGTEKLIDDVAMSGAANLIAAQSVNRLVYATPALTDTIHVSGYARVKLRIASSKPAANLSVWLVMMPYDSTRRGDEGSAGLVSRGWADIQNYKSLTGNGWYNSKTPGEPLVPGRFYDVTFDLQPADEFIPAGRRLAVMIMSSDKQFTLAPAAGTELTIDLAGSSITIPVVGGSAALTKAGVK
jgi:X-Pro dipeptidyl-peptidase